jgi:hypothetical protein
MLGFFLLIEQVGSLLLFRISTWVPDINALEAVLSNTKGSLAQTKEQLAESDSTVVSKFISSASFQLID